MILKKPFVYSRELRKQIQENLPFKLVINESMREYSKCPRGETINLSSLIEFIIKVHKIKRTVIPPKQLYLKHVVSYWKNNPQGSRSECLVQWKLKSNTQKSN